MKTIMKRLAAGILAAGMTLAGTSAAFAEETGPLTVEQKRRELDILVENLEEIHPDLYANISKEDFLKDKNVLAARAGELSDLEYNIALTVLVAKIGDSHTSTGIGNVQGVEVLPFVVKDFEGKWILDRVAKEQEAFLGAELTAINGRPVSEVEALLNTFVSHDTKTKAHRQFPYNAYIASLLEYYRIIPESGDVPLTLRMTDGTETVLELPRLLMSEVKLEWANLAGKRAAVPATDPDTSRNYWLAKLNPKTLYIQYNACVEDENIPMEEFERQVFQELNTGNYSKIAVDLRNNGGGSDGLIVPILFRLQEYAKEHNARIYTLIGETTFSSAVINAVEMDVLLDAVLVGTPTSGSVNHFGAVDGFQLPYSGIPIRSSTKYIDLDAFMANESMFNVKPTKTYGAKELMPDVSMPQTLEDYLQGRDTAVEWILKDEV